MNIIRKFFIYKRIEKATQRELNLQAKFKVLVGEIASSNHLCSDLEQVNKVLDEITQLQKKKKDLYFKLLQK